MQRNEITNLQRVRRHVPYDWHDIRAYLHIFIITNTMHTIGVDKITLFKTT